jgi:hypothetical protein
MNESCPTEPVPAFPGQRAAVALCVALLMGLGLALALVLRDNAHRGELEGVVESSAVGDTHYLSIPEPPPPEPFPAVAHLHGQPLIPAGYKRHEKREADLQPLAKDEATGLTIYQAPVKAKEAGEPPTYFLKTGPGEFLKVRPGSATAQ